MSVRNYKEIGKSITLNGFFSEYLPPCFSLDHKTLLNPPPSDCDLIPPYSFTMSRYNGNDARRTIFIPEIGSYLAAHFFMEENNIIQELVEYTETYNHSFSPILDDDDNIVHHEQAYAGSSLDGEVCTPRYIQNIGTKLIRSAGAKKVLKLDISNCYASFYMHMIPAILLGSECAETEYNKFVRNNLDPAISPKYLKYKKLDEAIRRQNLNRTNGLLPGILSSKIIAEAILTRIDQELENEGIHFVRYVDDYEIFIYDHEEKAIITIFSRVLRKYGFSINAEKTEIIDFPFYISENFEKLLKSKLSDTLEREDIIDIFNTFFELEVNGTKGAIRYLLKCFEREPPVISDLELYKAYLLTIMANNERSLSKSCALLISHKENLTLTQEHQQRVREMLHNHIIFGHDLEVIWLLYLLIEIGGISQGDSLITDIVDTNIELAHALLLRRNLLSDVLLASVISRAKSWLLLYELYATGNIDETTFVSRLNLSKNLSMYQHFKQKNIHFVS